MPQTLREKNDEGFRRNIRALWFALAATLPLEVLLILMGLADTDFYVLLAAPVFVLISGIVIMSALLHRYEARPDSFVGRLSEQMRAREEGRWYKISDFGAFFAIFSMFSLPMTLLVLYFLFFSDMYLMARWFLALFFPPLILFMHSILFMRRKWWVRDMEEAEASHIAEELYSSLTERGITLEETDDNPLFYSRWSKTFLLRDSLFDWIGKLCIMQRGGETVIALKDGENERIRGFIDEALNMRN